MSAVALLADLVRINSVNPDLVPGGAGEDQIAQFIAAWAEQHGLEAHLVEPVPGRPSVVVVARGTGAGKALMLNGHIDTVGVAGMTDPFTARVEDGKLYGRGAYDMKGGVAACLWAAACAQHQQLRGDVIVTCVADEEVASLGMQAVLKEWTADACIVTEPTALDVCVAHKGFVWLQVIVQGRAAHGSRPDLGVDAIAKAGRILTGVEDLDRTLRSGSGHPLVGTGSVHVSLIEGGQEMSSYPDRCTIGIERRTIPGETAAQVEAYGGKRRCYVKTRDGQSSTTTETVVVTIDRLKEACGVRTAYVGHMCGRHGHPLDRSPVLCNEHASHGHAGDDMRWSACERYGYRYLVVLIPIDGEP